METLIANELVKALGVPIALILLMGVYVFKTMRGSSPQIQPSTEVHVQMQSIRDTLARAEAREVRMEERQIRIETKIEALK